MNAPKTTISLTTETVRQALRAENEHWAKFKQYFTINHEVIQNLAGEPVYGLGCFAGLLSFINCTQLRKYEEVINFIEFETQSHSYMRFIRIIEDPNELSEKQLETLINFHCRRCLLVERLASAITQYIEKR